MTCTACWFRGCDETPQISWPDCPCCRGHVDGMTPPLEDDDE